MKNWHHKNFTIHDYDKVDSTNNLAYQLTKSGNINHDHIILAKTQNAGKGRYNRVWESPIGNLYFSLVLKPDKDINDIALLSFVAVTAMGLAITELSENKKISVKYKWPNDILFCEKKIAGLLLESDNSGGKNNFVIIGIGVNINSHPENTNYPATNLEACGLNTTSEILLKNFLDKFSDLYKTWLNFGFAPIRNLWLKNVFNLNKIISVNLFDQKLTGLFRNFDENGSLILELENKEIKLISSGEIFK